MGSCLFVEKQALRYQEQIDTCSCYKAQAVLHLCVESLVLIANSRVNTGWALTQQSSFHHDSVVLPSLRYQKVSEVPSQDTWKVVREGSISTMQQRI